MKRRGYLIGSGILFVIIIILWAVVLLLPKSVSTPMHQDTPKKQSFQAKSLPPPSTATPGSSSGDPNHSKEPEKYTTYSERAFDEAAGKENRILFFCAPWSSQCIQLDADINNQLLSDNTVILKVDYDSNQALRKKYGVTIQATFVRVDAKGEKVKSVVAYNNPVYEAVKPELGL